MGQEFRVLVLDAQPRTRQSIKALLDTVPNISLVQEAANASQAMHVIESLQPDLVLIDMHSLPLDGLTATHQIKSRWPRIKIVALATYAHYRMTVLSAGADAFVSKGEPPERLLSTIISLLSIQSSAK